MRLVKFVVGQLEVEPNEGNIWLNLANGANLLRITNIKFQNIIQKFSNIDIHQDIGFMIKESDVLLETDKNLLNINSFLIRLIRFLYIKSQNTNEKIDVDKLYDHIVKFFNS